MDDMVEMLNRHSTIFPGDTTDKSPLCAFSRVPGRAEDAVRTGGSLLSMMKFCIQNDGFCIQNDEICISNDGCAHRMSSY